MAKLKKKGNMADVPRSKAELALQKQ